MAGAKVSGLMCTTAKDDGLRKHVKLQVQWCRLNAGGLGEDELDPSLWFSGLGFVKTNGGSLFYNSFSDHLPVEIFNLTTLDISRNNFSGHFPVGVSALQNLIVLNAFGNSFSGSLPSEISELQNLKILNLTGNYFWGPIL
ncbi:leucine-rich repeat receptor-like protein kinase TDR [Pyrus ussuriensis x Pyrus communis]|uniref:Leucine-rich repeat receptor-like protein kinase TDR n=1 Tax=Pyrus ussuriensis x Pyrus communis TaxID=2448454 RepID=A0A5N5HVI8_9ROSA|nr:leucine-rich repeat receptor-like protein kinase TDR [Pyrus ussuriensis x Pyrus communis]